MESIFWLPDFGDVLSKSIFNEYLYSRLTWASEKSYYVIGQTSLKNETIKLAGSSDNHLNYLIFYELLPNFFKHVLVSIPILLRGMWIGGYAAFIPFIFLPITLRMMYQKKILNIFLILAFPSIFIIFFNAFVSVNVVRYNIPLIIPLSLSLSFYIFCKIKNLLKIL